MDGDEAGAGSFRRGAGKHGKPNKRKISDSGFSVTKTQRRKACPEQVEGAAMIFKGTAAVGAVLSMSVSKTRLSSRDGQQEKRTETQGHRSYK
jgi:hypothetical protein